MKPWQRVTDDQPYPPPKIDWNSNSTSVPTEGLPNDSPIRRFGVTGSYKRNQPLHAPNRLLAGLPHPHHDLRRYRAAFNLGEIQNPVMWSAYLGEEPRARKKSHLLTYSGPAYPSSTRGLSVADKAAEMLTVSCLIMLWGGRQRDVLGTRAKQLKLRGSATRTGLGCAAMSLACV